MTPLECEIIVGSIPAGAISRKGGSIWGMSIKAWEELGTSYLMFGFHRNLETDSLAEILARMERFATKVMPLVQD